MKNPYSEIIDLKAEHAEYARLCNGKSKKFKLYTDWEDHIKELLSDFRSPKDLYNFKHYCINAARSQEKVPDMFLGYIGLVLTVYVDKLLDGIPPLIILLVLIAMVGYVIIQNKRIAKESYFYTDLIEIIAVIEHTQDSLCRKENAE